MSDSYVGEIRMFAGNYAPLGWAFCDGQILSIAQNNVLFNLIGTTYGGDGEQSFALPDLRGRAPLHRDGSNSLGKAGGSPDIQVVDGFGESGARAVSVAADAGPGRDPVLAGTPDDRNIQPFQTVNFVISLYGIYPTQ